MNLFGSLKKTIFSFGLALALVFALLFYEEDRLKELFQIAKPDHLSVLYLKLLLNIKPDAVRLIFRSNFKYRTERWSGFAIWNNSFSRYKTGEQKQEPMPNQKNVFF